MAKQAECWWITGASSGIGAALSEALAREGVRLILSGRNVDALEQVSEKCGRDQCLVLPFEACDYSALPKIAARAFDWAGRIDCLVNNAGISQRSLAVETDFSVYERIVGVDLLAPIALTQAILPHMVAHGGGRLVAISSVAGIVGSPLRSAYSAAKHGLFGYFDSIRSETGHVGISVHVIAPGSIKTDVSRNALLADGSARGQSDDAIEKGMDPGEAARSMLESIRAGKREIILATGMEAHIAELRRSDPEGLFDLMDQSIRGGYAKKMGVVGADR